MLHDLRRRRHVVLHPDAQHRLVHDAGVDALEPVVPPAQRVLQEADLGTGGDLVGPGMGPGADEPLAGPRQALHETQHGVGVAVGPAADRVDGGLDGRVVLADRAVLPVVIAALVAEPGLGPVEVGVEALLPALAPAFAADHLRVPRQGVVVQHAGAPGEHVEARDAATLVVDVVFVAVVGRHERDDRLELGRPQGGDLQAVEAGPRDAGHAHTAGAPGLRGDPGEHLADVGVLLGGVLVEHHAVGVAGAAQVDAQAGVAVAGPPAVELPVAVAVVGETVGVGLEDRRHRLALGVVGKPDTGVEARAVGKGDPLVLDDVAPCGGTRSRTAMPAPLSV